MIQDAINRMAQNSFLLKGWSVTVAGGLSALGFKELDGRFFTVSLVVLFFFWLTDAYYLSRERLFVKLYNAVRVKSEKEIDFSMDTNELNSGSIWIKSAFSRTFNVFYGGLLIAHLFSILFVM